MPCDPIRPFATGALFIEEAVCEGRGSTAPEPPEEKSEEQRRKMRAEEEKDGDNKEEKVRRMGLGVGPVRHVDLYVAYTPT
jgi:hypothetical protein